MKVSVRLISDSNGLHEVEGVWNVLVNKHSKNPILLSGFVKQFMEFNRSKGWTPLVLRISVDDMIVGIVPLMSKKKFGFRFVKFLFRSWFSPDFIVGDQYRETCIGHTLDFLFKTLRCRFVELTLPVESPNLRILKQKCKDKKIYFFTKPGIAHCIIRVGHTWDEFQRLRGRDFRYRFKRIERHLDRAGAWRITCIDNGNTESDVYGRVLDVEKKSWKEAWRTRREMKIDPDLFMIWKGSQYTARTQPDFKWSIWFLELNDQPLAYTLVLQYKGMAFLMKTSYDERFKRFSPGMYILNTAIRELFHKREVRNIDFLTDFPFERTWTSMCLPRVRVMMSPKGFSAIIVRASSKLAEFSRVMRPRQLEEKVIFF